MYLLIFAVILVILSMYSWFLIGSVRQEAKQKTIEKDNHKNKII
jgi:hypothetical protein